MTGRTSRDDRSVMGVALRPTASDLFDVLAKLEWRRTMNALGSSSFADSTEYRRLIGAADAVWSLAPGTEMAIRYALRWSVWRDPEMAMPSPFAQFAGARMERPLVGRLSARLDGRFLFEQTTGATRWSAAPSLLYRLSPTLHLEGGHRFGDLVDLDFGTVGDEAGRFFATIGMRFTERLLTTPASFWRDRLQEE
ncbi:MAG TPA: hypothetical protein VEA99_09645, partial [Gemmatimonadaceae bacterium]|nr:hypothetical protein [Gemmatimonadaceae bacterium]